MRVWGKLGTTVQASAARQTCQPPLCDPHCSSSRLLPLPMLPLPLLLLLLPLLLLLLPLLLPLLPSLPLPLLLLHAGITMPAFLRRSVRRCRPHGAATGCRWVGFVMGSMYIHVEVHV